MVHAKAILKTGIVCLLASLGGYGCASKKAEERAPSYSQLKAISMAYAKATIDQDRPPINKEELMPFLAEVLKDQESADPADALRSKMDGEEFVIHWGLDCRDLRGPMAMQPVLAYEERGLDGKRYVLQNRYVRQVTDDQFAELPFPKGYKAP